MAMTVYVLENGCYSDTHIVGVYSSQARADIAAKVFPDNAQITSYEVDAHIEDMRTDRVPWFVRLHRETGDTLEAHRQESAYGAFSSAVTEDVHKNLYTHAWALDRETAIKIASERRRAFLALPMES